MSKFWSLSASEPEINFASIAGFISDLSVELGACASKQHSRFCAVYTEDFLDAWNVELSKSCLALPAVDLAAGSRWQTS